MKDFSFIPHLEKMNSVVKTIKKIDDDVNFSDEISNTIKEIIYNTDIITKSSIKDCKVNYYKTAFLLGALAGMLEVNSSLIENLPQNIIIIGKDDKSKDIEVSTASLILIFEEALEELLEYNDFRNQNIVSDTTDLSNALKNIEILSEFLSHINFVDRDLIKISWRIQSIFEQGNELIESNTDNYELAMKLEFGVGELTGMFFAKNIPFPLKLKAELTKVLIALLKI